MAAAAPFVIMGVGMAASAAASVVSSVSANKTAQKNYELQKEQYEYEKNLQGQIMEREDNAIQRQVADSRAAGISPLYQMAGAQSAGAAGVAVNTPQKEQTPNTMATVLQGIGSLSSLVSMYQQFKGTQIDQARAALDLEENQVMSPMRVGMMEDAFVHTKQMNEKQRQAADLSYMTNLLQYNDATREYNFRKNNNIYQSDPSIWKNIRSGATGLGSFLEALTPSPEEEKIQKGITDIISEYLETLKKDLTTPKDDASDKKKKDWRYKIWQGVFGSKNSDVSTGVR